MRNAQFLLFNQNKHKQKGFADLSINEAQAMKKIYINPLQPSSFFFDFFLF